MHIREIFQTLAYRKASTRLMLIGFARIGFRKDLCRGAGVTPETAVHLEGIHLERICQVFDDLQCLYFKLNKETLVTFTGLAFRAGKRVL